MKALPQVSRDLLEAARIVERGWCQNAMRQGSPFGPLKYCALGAIAEATDTDLCGPPKNWLSERFVAASVRVSDYLSLPDFGFVQEWNDEKGRTQAEVVKALQDAALKAGEADNG